MNYDTNEFEPYIPDGVIIHLDKRFGAQYISHICEDWKDRNDSYLLGFIAGMRHVIDYLQYMNEEQKGE